MNTKPKVKRTTVSDWLNESITVGGESTTRGMFIQESLAQGATQKQIDAYLMGMELRKEIEAKTMESNT